MSSKLGLLYRFHKKIKLLNNLRILLRQPVPLGPGATVCPSGQHPNSVKLQLTTVDSVQTHNNTTALDC